MFNKNDQRPAARSGNGTLSFLGAEVTVTGNIGGQGNLHIDGRVDGDDKRAESCGFRPENS